MTTVIDPRLRVTREKGKRCKSNRLAPRLPALPPTGVSGGLGSSRRRTAWAKASTRRAPSPESPFSYQAADSSSSWAASLLTSTTKTNPYPIRARVRARTSSTSSSWAFPLSTSLMRRQSSMSQASATSSSAGPSRLAIRSLASFARSASESARAASLRASGSVPMSRSICRSIRL